MLLRTRDVERVEPWILADDADLHAPELLDFEVLATLRRREQRRELEPRRAVQALADLRDLPISLYPLRPLLDRAWDLRANIGAADGLYAALAQALGAALLTTDRGFARALEAQTSLVTILP